MTKNICGAKTRASGGHPCGLPAGWGTNHPGVGKCKLHGGASTGAPKKNKNAEKHGLFSKYLPEESMEIMDAIEDEETIELLWDNIKIQYAAIIRAQKIMYVEDKNEIIKVITKETPDVTEYEYQMAWDRYEKFLTSQSRAMTILAQMISKYEELANSEQRLKAEKLKAEIEKIKGTGAEIEDMTEIIGDIYEIPKND